MNIICIIFIIYGVLHHTQQFAFIVLDNGNKIYKGNLKSINPIYVYQSLQAKRMSIV